jgi:hypothetical protein
MILSETLTSKKLLKHIDKQKQDPKWQQQRIEGKISRLSLTDEIVPVVERAKVKKSSKPAIWYMSFTKMIYKELFKLKEGFSQAKQAITLNLSDGSSLVVALWSFIFVSILLTFPLQVFPIFLAVEDVWHVEHRVVFLMRRAAITAACTGNAAAPGCLACLHSHAPYVYIV